ncbi:MAG TPA: MBL fold metallo-hydrolase [Planctomycetes bacterium]|nr:MBL fold metallo-hydrolase [Planctomycetota bacterium]HIJ72149.1 MBL fold metallo-hydrolase [Planctomycetota bacterium]
MDIKTFILGDYQTNSYCLRTAGSATDCLIIDTGLQSEPLIEHLKTNSLNPVAVVFTHGHIDHIAGLAPLRENWPDIKVAIHQADAAMFENPEMNLSAISGVPFNTGPADLIIKAEDTQTFAGMEFHILHTPGHTPGGISLYSKSEGVVFVGDALFAGSVGRTDFPGGNHNQLITSIKSKLLTLPGETRIYPGHGPVTTVVREKQTNPFLT